MRSAAKGWFTEEVRRAGWISAITCVIGAWACVWLPREVRERWGEILACVLFPMALGFVAVGVLNFRRWHSFQESMVACLAAVLDIFILLGALVLFAVLFSTLRGPILFYFLILLIFWAVLFALWIAALFLAMVLEAWLAGATLYGLLRLMRHVGELGRGASDRKEEPARALHMVV